MYPKQTIQCIIFINYLAITLDSSSKSVKWEVVGDTKEFPNPFYKLIIRQFLLGHEAKDGEYNVIEVYFYFSIFVDTSIQWKLIVFAFQVETSSMSESKPNQVKVPVAILKAGETRSIQTVLEFPDSPVTFNLVEGSGPVYIHGQQVPGNYEIEDTTELSGEEEEVS